VTNLHRANEELVDRLVEVTHLRDESADRARGGVAMAWINSDWYVALEGAIKATMDLVQLVRVRVVMVHGVRHGAAVALAAAHLRLQPGVNLRAVAPGFPLRAEVPRGIDVGWLIADFGVTANAIATVVDIEQVIEDTPH
jgi:hypothetical protein